MKNILIIFFILISLPAAVYSQDNLKPQDQEEINEKPNKDNTTIPEGLELKKPISEKDLKKKKEKGYLIPLPLYSLDVDKGFGYGLRLVYYNNGTRDDPYFAYTPYRYRIYGQFFQTTNGWQYHQLLYEAPYFMGSLFRIKSAFTFDKNIAATYFGTGENTLNTLTDPYGNTHIKYTSFKEKIRELQEETNTAYSKYVQYIKEKPSMKVSLERDIYKAFTRGFLGLDIANISVTDYTGKKVLAFKADGTEEKNAIMGTTKLKEDCDANIIKGCNGGWNNVLKFGFAYDTRDFEPDPNNGLFIDTVFEISNKLIGSEHNYFQYTFSPRFYYSPIENIADLVFTARYVFAYISKSAPFYALDNYSFTSGSKSGMGGYSTLRGYTQNRFIGNIHSLLNFEIRWTMFDIDILNQNFAFILVPFFDTGRIFDNISNFKFSGYKYGEGIGLRTAWNQSMVSFFDVGFSQEGVSYSMNFEHIF